MNCGTNSSFGADLTGAIIGTVSPCRSADDKSMTKSSMVDKSDTGTIGDTIVLRSRIFLRNDNSCGVNNTEFELVVVAEKGPTSLGIMNFGLIDKFATATVAVSTTASDELRRKWKLAKSDSLLNVGDICAAGNCGLPPNI